MQFNNYLEDLNKELLNNCAELEMENKKLHEENAQLKKQIEKLRSRLQKWNGEINEGNKMGRYVDGIRNGAFKPRLNNDVDEQAVLRTILKLKTTDLNEIAEVLGVSYSTIRRRLINYRLYPIDLQDIKDTYIMFYSADKE
ncbi:hypothetical protein SDC9_178376 [bioreactor metagenome]|uniref:Uncharacterized protein n=1 Tax=bioreactor metagenome TaxID=1076179 RepID=A0A645GVT4_9ZZZZ